METRTIKAFPAILTNGSSLARHRRGLFFKTGWAETRSQSYLAKECAPPERKGLWWRLVVFVASLVLLWFSNTIAVDGITVPALVFTAATAAILVYAIKWNISDYPALFTVWQNSYFCMKCGRVTIVD